jgi:hypothetical protein
MRIMQLFVIALSAIFLACSSKSKEPDCVPASTDQGQPMKVTRTPVIVPAPQSLKDGKWCQACVIGPKGWASCQVAFAQNESEAEEALKARSREQACLDAGFEKGKCPQDATVRIKCKGDSPSKNQVTPGKALQDLFYGTAKPQAKPAQPKKAERPAQ